jgi:hypothetical protein
MKEEMLIYGTNFEFTIAVHFRRSYNYEEIVVYIQTTLMNILLPTFRAQFLHNSGSITVSIKVEFKRKELQDSY